MCQTLGAIARLDVGVAGCETRDRSPSLLVHQGDHESFDGEADRLDIERGEQSGSWGAPAVMWTLTTSSEAVERR